MRATLFSHAAFACFVYNKQLAKRQITCRNATKQLTQPKGGKQEDISASGGSGATQKWEAREFNY